MSEKSEVIGVRVTSSRKREIQEIAKRNDRAMSRQVERWIREGIQRDREDRER